MNVRKLSCYGIGFLFIEFLFWFVAKTPRARLNVTQLVALLFFAILIFQFRTVHSEAGNAPQSFRKSILLPCLGILSGMIIWGSMLTCYFLGDDYVFVYMARTPMLELMTSVFRHGGDGGTFYRPLTLISYSWDHAVWGEWPTGYHFTNLVLHFGSVVGLFALSRQLGVGRRVSAITAGIFAAMPIQVESVAWMSGRFDILSTMLLLWAVSAYLRARSKNSLSAYLLAMFLFVLAMLSKESAFVLPLLLIGIDFTMFRARPGWRIAGFIVLGGLVFGYRLFALGGIGGYNGSGGYSVFDFGPKTLEGLFVRGPSQMLFGINWTQPNDIIVTSLASVMALLLIVLVSVGKHGNEHRAVIKLALIWILITMVPAHFLLLIGSGLSNSRILYLPSAGIAMLLGQLLGAVDARRFQGAGFIVLIAVLNLGVLHNLAAWRWTSLLARRTLQSVAEMEPSPAPQTQFIISKLPDTVRGVFFFREGLTEGLRITYGRDDIRAIRDTNAPAAQHPQIRLLWKGTSGSLLQRQ